MTRWSKSPFLREASWDWVVVENGLECIWIVWIGQGTNYKVWAFPLYLCTWVDWSILHELLPIRQLLIQLTSCGHNWPDAWVCSLSGSITWCESWVCSQRHIPTVVQRLVWIYSGLLATSAMLWTGEIWRSETPTRTRPVTERVADIPRSYSFPSGHSCVPFG